MKLKDFATQHGSIEQMLAEVAACMRSYGVDQDAKANLKINTLGGERVTWISVDSDLWPEDENDPGDLLFPKGRNSLPAIVDRYGFYCLVELPDNFCSSCVIKVSELPSLFSSREALAIQSKGDQLREARQSEAPPEKLSITVEDQER